MANTLTEVIPQLLAQGLMALRENAITPQLINRGYESMAGEKGSTIDVPIPSAIAVQDVNPNSTPATTADIGPTSVSLVMDQWKEAPFYLTDKDLLEIMNGTIPMQASEAIKALGNTVDVALLGLYKDIYGFAGTPGTTPFASSTGSATAVRKVLHNQLCPMMDRRMVIDPDAEANALNLRAFQDVNFAVSSADIQGGNMPRKLGFNFYMDQNVVSHTAGSIGGTPATTPTYVTLASHSAGATQIGVTVGGTNGLSLTHGDILTFTGDSQTYVVKAAVSASASSTATIRIAPALQSTLLSSATITVKGTSGTAYAQNMGFHRDAFAFASRPLADNTQGLGNLIQSAVDPVTGLTLRLEISREHKRTRFSYDILYGLKTIRAALACRLWG